MIVTCTQQFIVVYRHEYYNNISIENNYGKSILNNY